MFKVVFISKCIKVILYVVKVVKTRKENRNHYFCLVSKNLLSFQIFKFGKYVLSHKCVVYTTTCMKGRTTFSFHIGSAVVSQN